MQESYCVVATTMNGSITYFSVLQFQNELQWFYDTIRCEHIEIVKRKIRGQYYCFIVDDEGMLKRNFVSLTSVDRKELLFGNVIICRDLGEELVGMDYEEADELIDALIEADGYTF